MYIILVTDPKQIQNDGKPLQWREFFSDSVFAACEIKEHKRCGRIVERYNPNKHGTV